MMKKILLRASIFIALISGCADRPVKKDFSFNANSKTGLIVVGVAGNFPSFLVDIAPFNESALSVQGFGPSPAGIINHNNGSNWAYYVLSMEPGNYVFKLLSESHMEGMKQITNNVCLAHGTYEFTVQAGRAIYIGNLWFAGTESVATAQGDILLAEQALMSYQNIQTAVEKASLKRTSFNTSFNILNPLVPLCGSYSK